VPGTKKMDSCRVRDDEITTDDMNTVRTQKCLALGLGSIGDLTVSPFQLLRRLLTRTLANKLNHFWHIHARPINPPTSGCNGERMALAFAERWLELEFAMFTKHVLITT